MKKSILLIVSIMFISTMAFAFEKVPSGSYNVAFEMAECVILTEPTVTKRAICAATGSTSNTVVSMTSNNNVLKFGGGWEPGLMQASGSGYVGSGRSMGIRIDAEMLTFNRDGILVEELYLPGSGQPDIKITYAFHYW